jgi:hypothetical protein
MRRILTARLMLASAGAVGTLLLGQAPANGTDPVCQQRDPQTQQCLVWVSVDPTPTPQLTHDSGPGSTGGDAGPACYSDGSNIVHQGPVPCQENGHWWSNENQCYMWLAEPQPPPTDPAWGGHYPDGVIYACQRLAYGAIPIWLANPPDSPGRGSTPYQIAQQAIARLNLNAISVGIVPEPGPGKMGVVGMPVWMWVENPSPTTYGPATITASAGGITVTLTAKVEKVEWNMGDGTAPVVCTSAGTPYADHFGKRDSPTCGHQYETTSWNQPRHTFTVTASSYWRIDWAGAGQSGTIRTNPLEQTVELRVGEAQVLTQ